MRALILCALLAFLAACTGPQAPPTPAQAVHLLSGQYNVLLGEIAAYEAQPRCVAPAVVACSDPDVVEELRAFVAEANPLVDEAERIAQATPNDGNAISNAASAARGAIRRLEQYLIQEGI